MTANANADASQKRRVVITGIGIVSCLGNDPDAVTAALRDSRCGIRSVKEYAELGLDSRLAGIPDLKGEPSIDRKLRRFMADAAIYGHHAMRKAIDDACLQSAEVAHPRTGLIVGSGVGSPAQQFEAIEVFRQRGLAKLLPYYVPQVMGSTVSAGLAMAFAIQGPSYTITSACASSAHCIGNAADQIRHGILDRVFVGGAEEVAWVSTVIFDAMGALSTGRNDSPKTASRPFDRDRDGFVIAGGAGILVLEAEETARARGAHVYAEISGYGACSDGKDMVQPDPDGITRAMRAALEDARHPRIDYINAHATSTPLGDAAELTAICRTFGNDLPAISSTKGLTGHAIAAAGAHEAIYSLLMMKHGFLASNANLEHLDDGCEGIPLVRSVRNETVDCVLSNSLGFGGTNVSLIFSRR